MTGRFIAIDWGTTNRRVYRLCADGVVEAAERDDRGVLAVAPGAFPAEVAAIRARLGDLPVLCAGMVGSDRGWVPVPYLPCPVGIAALADGLHHREPDRVAIVPGVLCADGDRRDVMRGEEVQLLGAVAAGLAPASGLLCQPGTHCKWAWMADGAIARFATAMTGEMFAMLQRHSLLSAQLSGTAAVGPAFLAGVADAGDDDLLARLFGVRADRVSGHGAIADPTSYVSGLLIGQDVRRRIAPGDSVHVLADPLLGDLYCTAIAATGGHATRIDSQAAFTAGISRIWSHSA